MKKELFALSLLILILSFSICNSLYLDRLTQDMAELISRAAAEPEKAEGYIAEAERLWEGNSTYLQSVLRHSEFDVVHENFYEIKKSIAEGDEKTIKLAAEHMTDHLRGMSDMEKPRIGSIF